MGQDSSHDASRDGLPASDPVEPGVVETGGTGTTGGPDGHRGLSRRTLLLGVGAVLATGATGWGVARLFADGTGPGPDGGTASPAPDPSEPCLVERDFPDDFPDELSVLDRVILESSVLGTPFTQLSVQDVVVLMGTDERERLVITQHGATAQIQLVPLERDSPAIVHDVEVGVNPGVAVGSGVAWFVTREDGRVLSVGPDPAALRDYGSISETATSLYSPVIGSSGRVFGGSYPTGSVWRLDPATSEISVGPQIDGNEYVRSVAVVDDRLFAGTGGRRPALHEIDLETLESIAVHEVPGVREGGAVSRLAALPGGSLLVFRDEDDGGRDGIFFDPGSGAFGDELAPGPSSRALTPDASGDEFFFVAGDVTHRVDAGTLVVREAGTSPISNPTALVTLSSGAVLAVGPDPSGAASVMLAPLIGGGAPREIEVEPTSHDLTAVIPLPSISSLAIGGYQAHGAVVVDADGTFLARTAEDSGVQQVEGGIEIGRSTFTVGSYGEGRIHSLTVVPEDPVLESAEVSDLGETFQQARPLAWALVDGGLLIGTAPEQGRLGGVVQGLALSVAGPSTAGTIENPADGRSIVGIVAADDSEIVLTTSVRGGYGAGPAAQEAVVMRISLPDGKVLWKTPVGVLDAYTPRLQRGRVFCATTDGMLVLDADTGELLAHTVIGEPADSAGYYAARIEPWQAQGRFVHVARGKLSFIDLVDGTVVPGPDSVGSPLTLLGARLYAASGNRLVRFELPSDPALPDCTD